MDTADRESEELTEKGIWQSMSRSQKAIAFLLSVVAIFQVFTAVANALGMGPMNLPGRQLDNFRSRVDTLSASVDTLRNEIRSNRAERMAQMDSLREWVRPMLVGECLDRTPREIALMRIHCTQVINGQ